MIKTACKAAVIAVVLCLCASAAFAASQLIGQTEVLLYDKEKADDGYTMFYTGGTCWLIDMEGNLLKSWPGVGSNPQLQENGNIVVTGPKEFNWEGDVVFEWPQGPDLITALPHPAIEECRVIHHDQRKIYNTKLGEYTYLSFADVYVKYDVAIENGSDPDNSITETGMWRGTADMVVETSQDGDIVWYWWFWDHIVQNYDPTKESYGDPAAEENYGKLDINCDSNTRTGLSNDWNHCNSMDYNPHLDQVIVNSREHGEVYVIDHNTTTEEAAGPAGDFVWRWGNPFNYGHGMEPTYKNNGDAQIFGAHCIHWIDDYEYTNGRAIPGAGNLLIFDNGSYRPGFMAKSYITEFNPFLDAEGEDTGWYVRQEDAGYTKCMYSNFTAMPNLYNNLSNQVVWQFSTGAFGLFSKGMYSSHISGCQRLPNGNTLMCAGEEGHFVEVTPGEYTRSSEMLQSAPEVVWEYVTPVLRDGSAVTYLNYNQAPDVFRCYRYSQDHPAFVGKNLKPVHGTITGRVPFSTTYKMFQGYTGLGFTGGSAGGGAAGVGGGPGTGGGY